MASERDQTAAGAYIALIPEIEAMSRPVPADLPAWQAVLARVRKLTRFDAGSLELISHETVPGTVAATRNADVRFAIDKVRVAGALPADVRAVSGIAQIEANLQDQRAACEAAVDGRLEGWRAANADPAATPESARFLQGCAAVGYSQGCGSCEGRGKNSCSNCGARGQLTCSGCNGRGQLTCFSCSGHGNVRCHACGGSGVQVGGHHSCIGCNGRGTNMCLSCAGQRWVNCNRCGGSREERCGNCQGSGAVRCAPCNATGTISVIGRISCTVSASDTVRFTCDDQALLGLLRRFTTVASAGQHARLAIDSSEVEDACIVSTISGRFFGDRFRVRVGSDALDLYGMRYSGTVLDYRNIIGRLLEADLNQLDTAAAARFRPALAPAPQLVAALGNVLESEAVSLALRGKTLPASEGTLIGNDFSERVRALAGKVLRWIHWQTAMPAVLMTLVLPLIGYQLLWRLPGDKNLNEMGAMILFGPMAIGLVLDWWLRRRLLARMGPVARPALQRLLDTLGHIKQARVSIAVAALVGTLYAMRMWLF